MFTKRAARDAAEMGYTNVLAYLEGIPGWQKAGYPIESSIDLPKVKIPQVDPKKLQGQLGEVCLVDVRDKERAKTGVIPGTCAWISIFEIMDRYSELPKDKPLVVYDTSDKLALVAGRFLASKGYKVKRLKGGVAKWLGAGLPTDPVK